MRSFAVVVFLQAMIVSLSGFSQATAAPAIQMPLVEVGQPGNAHDSAGGGQFGGHFGGVDYEYMIGTYAVTAGQYTQFLNSVAADDPFGLYHTSMAHMEWGSGITRHGSAGAYSYEVAPLFVDRPVNFVSWAEAARFANWMHHGQPAGAAGLSTTESGAYWINGATTAQAFLAVERQADARWAIPSEDEWYKAAYYDPALDDYWHYPTQSNTAPGNDLDDESGNNANIMIGTVIPQPIDGDLYTTIVGQFHNSPSPWGTFDQAGNVHEWTEAIIDYTPINGAVTRSVRGGAFTISEEATRSTDRNGESPLYRSRYIGFRLVQLDLDQIILLPGDANGDGVVDDLDLAIVQANLGMLDAAWEQGDFTEDGRVGLRDAFVLLEHYGSPVAQTTYISIPEPGSVTLMMLGMMMLASRRCGRVGHIRRSIAGR
ncbi:MAG: SUMF1/EgtB/PvdO family nonheme iron enzyme [Phycisphaeraceae bacterium]|nr:SUMF1/EgtB/PvdO family nonheme iron enzyme [Phycisphaeraceae bacterium]